MMRWIFTRERTGLTVRAQTAMKESYAVPSLWLSVIPWSDVIHLVYEHRKTQIDIRIAGIAAAVLGTGLVLQHNACCAVAHGSGFPF